MYKENPGVDMFKLDLHIVSTGNSAASLRKVVPIMTKLGLKLVRGEEIGPPEEEGYIMRGIRKISSMNLEGLKEQLICWLKR